MHLFDVVRDSASNESMYATNEDFRKLFSEDVNSLYLLSFLLTANLGKAERCFVAGLDDCVNGNRVFHEWAHSWARRIIVQNAIRTIEPHMNAEIAAPGARSLARKGKLPAMPLEYAQFANVLALEDFERFVFVLSVLERYPDRECAALLGTSRQEVQNTRIRALQHLADFERPDLAPAIRPAKEDVVTK